MCHQICQILLEAPHRSLDQYQFLQPWLSPTMLRQRYADISETRIVPPLFSLLLCVSTCGAPIRKHCTTSAEKCGKWIFNLSVLLIVTKYNKSNKFTKTFLLLSRLETLYSRGSRLLIFDSIIAVLFTNIPMLTPPLLEWIRLANYPAVFVFNFWMRGVSFVLPCTFKIH